MIWQGGMEKRIEDLEVTLQNLSPKAMDGKLDLHTRRIEMLEINVQALQQHEILSRSGGGLNPMATDESGEHDPRSTRGQYVPQPVTFEDRDRRDPRRPEYSPEDWRGATVTPDDQPKERSQDYEVGYARGVADGECKAYERICQKRLLKDIEESMGMKIEADAVAAIDGSLKKGGEAS